MKYPKSVLITANSKQSILLYRSELIKALNEQNIDVNIVSNTTAIFAFLTNLRRKPVFISSDGRSNLLMLLFCWLDGIIILNGLGRYEKSKFVRMCIINLIKIRKSLTFIVQSYRDYRYFSQHIDPNRVMWIPGSGGTKRVSHKGESDRILIVSRDSKFKFIKNYILSNKIKLNIDIIGLSEIWTKAGVRSLGRTTQKKLFVKHNKFLQIYYYGEGTPHTLVDAFSSEMDIYIDMQSFRNFGIYKYIKPEFHMGDLLILKSQSHGYSTYRNLTASKNVLQMYISAIDRKLIG